MRGSGAGGGEEEPGGWEGGVMGRCELPLKAKGEPAARRSCRVGAGGTQRCGGDGTQRIAIAALRVREAALRCAGGCP